MKGLMLLLGLYGSIASGKVLMQAGDWQSGLKLVVAYAFERMRDSPVGSVGQWVAQQSMEKMNLSTRCTQMQKLQYMPVDHSDYLSVLDQCKAEGRDAGDGFAFPYNFYLVFKGWAATAHVKDLQEVLNAVQACVQSNQDYPRVFCEIMLPALPSNPSSEHPIKKLNRITLKMGLTPEGS